MELQHVIYVTDTSYWLSSPAIGLNAENLSLPTMDDHDYRCDVDYVQPCANPLAVEGCVSWLGSMC